MRDIRFRAWDNKNEKMWFSSDSLLVVEDWSGMMWLTVGAFPTLSSKLEKYENYDIMQFTGLLDKSGKEIYEGDIVKYSVTSDPMPCEGLGEVKFRDGEYCADGYTLHYLLKDNDTFVIGNIYENPELLK